MTNDARQHDRYRPWAHRFACLLVVATFLLLITGGNVTSKGVGLSVPDWPTVYGHNMFTFPVQMWVGGIFDEHIHRLKGSFVGLLTILAVCVAWMPVWNAKLPLRFGRRGVERVVAAPGQDRPWLRWFSLVLLALVIIQGVLGGLRVTELSQTLAILHGVHGQIFFCLTVLFAAALGKLWVERDKDCKSSPSSSAAGLRWLTLAALAVLLIQLALGATMRHTEAGLAIPDFPSSYGGLVPPFSQEQLDAAHDAIVPYEQHVRYHTPAQVGVHFAHRIGALVVVGVCGLLATRAVLALPVPAIRRPAAALMALLLLQVALGAMVIWTGRAVHVATAHQALGAAALATATLLTIRIHLLTAASARRRQSAPWTAGGVALEGNH